MGYLMYCIFRSREQQRPMALPGVDGRPVFLVSESVLSAAVSGIDPGELTPNIPRILSYKKVVESFHGDPAICGVIPIRYGCLFGEEPGIIRFLKEHRRPYESLLKELEGCMEMGIRIMNAERGMRSAELKEGGLALSIPKSKIQSPKSKVSGRAYLAARKTHYAGENRLTKEMENVIERFCAAFSGLFEKCKTETPSSRIPNQEFRNPMLSLYFLVPRKSIGKFREVFRHLSCAEPAKLLLSGPWPPYNFVLPDHPCGPS
jgi:hypothetical protein